MITKKIVGILTGLALAGASLSACSSSGSTDNSGNLETTDFAGIQKEYLETLDTLTFPEGTSKPTSLEGEDETILFEKGWGNTLASNDWQCAWEKEWLNTYATAPERAEAALKELEKAPKMAYMQEPKADHTVRDWFAELMEKAHLGDPSQMQTDVDLNCP